jgi:hypothetical protein
MKMVEGESEEAYDILMKYFASLCATKPPQPSIVCRFRLSSRCFEGKAIQIHPMVCSAFNADFDGDRWRYMCHSQTKLVGEENLMLFEKSL